MFKVTLSKAYGLCKVSQKFCPAPIVLKKDKRERKMLKPKKLLKRDHNPAAAAISRTYMKTKKRPWRAT